MAMHSTLTTKRLSGVRSANGCWICRLRRKKCDETQPYCQTCTSLGIDCEGYGPRPPWMDRGPLEREKAETLRAKIARAGRKRRRASLKSPTGDSTGPRCSSIGQFETEVLPNTPRVTEDTQSLANGCLGLINPRDGLWTDYMINWQDQVHPIRSDGGASKASQPVTSTLRPSLDEDPTSGDFYPQSLRSPSPFGQNDGHLFGNLGHIVDDETSACWDSTRFQADSMLTTTGSPGASRHELDDLLPGLLVTSSNASNLDLTISSRNPSLEKAIMLSYYLNKVLPEQFRFSSISDTIGQQWMQALYIWESSPDLSRTYGTDISKAMRILRTLASPNAPVSMFDKEQKAMQAVVACACFHQVICLELGYGGSSHWQQCLTQASPYTQILIDIVVRGVIDVDPSGPFASATRQTLLAAAKTLLARLIWLDIMAAISTGSRLYLQLDHSYLLSLESINMVSASGCETWVVRELYLILALQEWKKQAEAEQNLNIMELATRGATILQSLKERIAHRDNTITEAPGSQARGADGDRCSNGAKKGDEYTSKCITVAFAQAATIYLHVVLSGPLPYLQDIRAAQADLRSTLHVLASEKLTIYAAWPVCVAACFATGDEQDALLSPASLEVRGNLKVSKIWTEALNIGQKCRSIRKDGKSADWTSAMESLHTSILLA